MDKKMVSTLSKRMTVGLFAVSIFVSAFLLFQVQPIIGKYVLPWFGGSPGVWTTCMLFFQVTLFAGYCYAHLLHRLLSVRQQIVWHCILLLGAIVTLPINPSVYWKPAGDESPTWLILSLLACKVGVPYFLLSSTGPLLQSWLGSTQACQRPYRLYSLSNVGSMLALLSFPFFIEPRFSSSEQSTWWSWAFVGFVLSCITSGVALYRMQAHGTAPESSRSRDSGSSGAVPFCWTRCASWFALPALASALLLATTNQLCVDTGSIPFLWIAPLAVYLFSFILTFDSDRWYNQRLFIMVAAISLVSILMLKNLGVATPLVAEVGLYVLSLFACCMVCHGEVVSLKPAPAHMTFFYLTLSAGGACGGIFVGLIAPAIFRGYFEWQLCLFACLLLFVDLYLSYHQRWQSLVTPQIKFLGAASILAVAAVALNLWDMVGNQQLDVKRNFYGVLSVRQQTDPKTGFVVRNLVHGRIIHGSQFADASRRLEPTSYYTANSGVGQVFNGHKPQLARQIGIVGLGAGTLAAYGKSQDQIRFYEINPDVILLAQQHFSFLSSSAAQIDFVLGDARLMLEREPARQYDILVVDAFSGDAIPVHLLTGEAMKVYDSHLQNDGVLAFHVSNLYFDLAPIAVGLANSQGYHSQVVIHNEDPQTAALSSTWVLMSKSMDTLESVSSDRPNSLRRSQPVLWTDDRNNLFEAIR